MIYVYYAILFVDRIFCIVCYIPAALISVPVRAWNSLAQWAYEELNDALK